MSGGDGGGERTGSDAASLAAEPHGAESRRLPPLLGAAAIGAAALALALLIGLLVDHRPFAFDRAIIAGLRVAGQPQQPVGPAWLRQAMVSVTALGGGTVLTIVVAAAAGLMLVRRLWLTATLTLAATVSGSVAVQLVKGEVARARPPLAGRLVEAAGMSFPSGHSANSAIVYLTLAALAAQVVPGRAAKGYLVAVAVLLVGAIGCSRVYLGVHWPSDVLAGWSFGTVWALAWWWAGAASRRRLARV